MKKYKSYGEFIGGGELPTTSAPTISSYLEASEDYVGLANKNLSIKVIRGLDSETHNIIFDDNTLTRALSDISEAGAVGNGLNVFYPLNASVEDARIVIKALDPTITELQISYTPSFAGFVLGFYPFPHPQGVSYRGDLIPANSSSSNRALNSGGMLIPFEDRTTRSINRGLAYLGNNQSDIFKSVKNSRVVTDVQNTLCYAELDANSFRVSHIIFNGGKGLNAFNSSAKDFLVGREPSLQNYLSLKQYIPAVDEANLIYSFSERDVVLTAEPMGDIFKGALAVAYGRKDNIADLPINVLRHDIFLSFCTADGVDILERESGELVGPSDLSWSYIYVGDADDNSVRDSINTIASNPSVVSNVANVSISGEGDYVRAEGIGTIMGPMYNLTSKGRCINHFTFMFDEPQASLNIVHKGDTLLLADGIYEIDVVCPDLRTITIYPFSHDLSAFMLRELPKGFEAPATLTPKQGSEHAQIFVSHVLDNPNLIYIGGFFGFDTTDANSEGQWENKHCRVRRHSNVSETHSVTDGHRKLQYLKLQKSIDGYSEGLKDSKVTDIRALRASALFANVQNRGNSYATGYTVYSPERSVERRLTIIPTDLPRSYHSFNEANQDYRSYLGGPISKTVSHGALNILRMCASYETSFDSNLGYDLRRALELRELLPGSVFTQLDGAIGSFTNQSITLYNYVTYNSKLSERSTFGETVSLILDMTAASNVYNTAAILDIGHGFRVDLSEGSFSEEDLGRIFVVKSDDHEFTVSARLVSWGSPISADLIPINSIPNISDRLLDVKITPLLGFADTSYGRSYATPSLSTSEDNNLKTDYGTEYHNYSDKAYNILETSYSKDSTAVSKFMLANVNSNDMDLFSLCKTDTALFPRNITEHWLYGIVSLSKNISNGLSVTDPLKLDTVAINRKSLRINVSGFRSFANTSLILEDANDHSWLSGDDMLRIFSSAYHSVANNTIETPLNKASITTAFNKLMEGTYTADGDTISLLFKEWLSDSTQEYDVFLEDGFVAIEGISDSNINQHIGEDSVFVLRHKSVVYQAPKVSLEHRDIKARGKAPVSTASNSVVADDSDPYQSDSFDILDSSLNIGAINVRNVETVSSSLVGNDLDQSQLGMLTFPMLFQDTGATDPLTVLASLYLDPTTPTKDVQVKQVVYTPIDAFSQSIMDHTKSLSVFEFQLTAQQLATFGIAIEDSSRTFRYILFKVNKSTYYFKDAYDHFLSTGAIPASANRYGTSLFPNPLGHIKSKEHKSCKWCPLTITPESNSAYTIVVSPVHKSHDLPVFPVITNVSTGYVSTPNRELGRTLSTLVNPVDIPFNITRSESNTILGSDDYLWLEADTLVGFQTSSKSGSVDKVDMHAKDGFVKDIRIHNTWSSDESSYPITVTTDSLMYGQTAQYGQPIAYRGVLRTQLKGADNLAFISHTGFPIAREGEILNSFADPTTTFDSTEYPYLWSVRHKVDALDSVPAGMVFKMSNPKTPLVYPYSLTSKLLPISIRKSDEFNDYNTTPSHLGGASAIRITHSEGFGIHITNDSLHGDNSNGNHEYLGSPQVSAQVTSDIDLRSASILTEGDFSTSIFNFGGGGSGNLLALHSFGASLFRGLVKITGDLPYTVNSDMNLLPDKDILSGVHGHINPAASPRYHFGAYAGSGNGASLKIRGATYTTTSGIFSTISLPTFKDYFSSRQNAYSNYESIELRRQGNSTSTGEINPELGERTSVIDFSVGGVFSSDSPVSYYTRAFNSPADVPNDYGKKPTGYNAFPSLHQIESGNTSIQPGLLGVFAARKSVKDLLWIAASCPLFSLGKSSLGRTIVFHYNTTAKSFGYFTGIIDIIDSITVPGASVLGIRLSNPEFTGSQWSKFSTNNWGTNEFITDLRSAGITYIDTNVNMTTQEIISYMQSNGTLSTSWESDSSDLFPNETGTNNVFIHGSIHGREWVLNAYQVNVSDRLFVKNDLGNIATTIKGDRDGSTTISGGRLNILNSEVFIPNLIKGRDVTYTADITCLIRKALRPRYGKDQPYLNDLTADQQARALAPIGSTIDLQSDVGSTVSVVKTSDLVCDQGLYTKLIVDWSKDGEIIVEGSYRGGSYEDSHFTLSKRPKPLKLGFDYITQTYGMPLLDPNVADSALPSGSINESITRGTISLPWSWSGEDVTIPSTGESINISAIRGYARVTSDIQISVTSTVDAPTQTIWHIPEGAWHYLEGSSGDINLPVVPDNVNASMTFERVQEFTFKQSTLSELNGFTNVTVNQAIINLIESGYMLIDLDAQYIETRTTTYNPEDVIYANDAVIDDIIDDVRNWISYQENEYDIKYAENQSLEEHSRGLETRIEELREELNHLYDSLEANDSGLISLTDEEVSEKQEEITRLLGLIVPLEEELDSIDDELEAIEEELFNLHEDQQRGEALLDELTGGDYSAEEAISLVESSGLDIPITQTSVITQDTYLERDRFQPSLSNFNILSGINVIAEASVEYMVNKPIKNFTSKPVGVLMENHWVNWAGVPDSIYHTEIMNPTDPSLQDFSNLGGVNGAYPSTFHPIGAIVNALSRPYIELLNDDLVVKSVDVQNVAPSATISDCLPVGHHTRKVYTHNQSKSVLYSANIAGIYVNRSTDIYGRDNYDYLNSWYVPTNTLSEVDQDVYQYNSGQAHFKTKTSEIAKSPNTYHVTKPLNVYSGQIIETYDKEDLKFYRGWGLGANTDVDSPMFNWPSSAGLGPTIINFDGSHDSAAGLLYKEVSLSGGIYGLVCRPENINLSRELCANRIIPFKLNFSASLIANRVGSLHPFDFISSNWSASSHNDDTIFGNSSDPGDYRNRYQSAPTNIISEKNAGIRQSEAYRYTNVLTTNNAEATQYLKRSIDRFREHIIRYKLEVNVHEKDLDFKSKLDRFISLDVAQILAITVS